MNKIQLVDQITSRVCLEKGKLESRRSWLTIRRYLEKLNIDQLQEILNEYD